MIDINELLVSLYDKMDKELTCRKEEMIKESAEDIINGFIPYELVYKKDLLACFEENYVNLTEADYNFLLKLEKPLDWLYIQWLDSDDSHMGILRGFIENTLEYRRRR